MRERNAMPGPAIRCCGRCNFATSRHDVRMMRLLLGQDPYREERVIEVRLAEQRARHV